MKIVFNSFKTVSKYYNSTNHKYNFRDQIYTNKLNLSKD